MNSRFQRFNAFFWLILAIGGFLSEGAYAQRGARPLRRPQFYKEPLPFDSTKPVEPSAVEEYMPHPFKECEAFSVGKLRRVTVDLSMLNNWLLGGGVDDAHTVGVYGDLAFEFDHATIGVRYNTDLYTKETPDPLQSLQNGENVRIQTFPQEIVDLQAYFRQDPDPRGNFFEIFAGVKSWGNDEKWYGARALQAGTHAILDHWHLGTKKKNYVYGDERHDALLVGAKIGKQYEEPDQKYWVSGTLGAQLATSFEDASSITGEVDGGITLCRKNLFGGENRNPFAELRMTLHSERVLNGEAETWFRPGLQLDLWKGQGGSNLFFFGGYVVPIEENHEMDVYDNGANVPMIQLGGRSIF